MSSNEQAPMCFVCKRVETAEAYELDDEELNILRRTFKLWRARRIQAEFGAVPICRECIDGLGFAVEGRPDTSPALVRIRSRQRD